MGSFGNHQKLYETFKKDAQNPENSHASRVELYFLSLFHLIEACAASSQIHINRHQAMRRVLERTPDLFGEHTETVWRAFQTLESRLRPKFSYGFSGGEADFREVVRIFGTVEEICLEVLDR